MKYQSLIIKNQKKEILFDQIAHLVREKNSIDLSKNIIDRLEIFGVKNSIGIKEVEDIAAWAYKKDSNLRSIIIYNSEKLTEEAQNSLLKIIEEPPENVIIILVTSNEDALLTTIKSRCLTISSNEKEEESKFNKEAKAFLEGNYLERAKIIDRMSSDDLERSEICEILFEMIKILSKIDINKVEPVKKAYKGIKRGTNVKLTLDALSINLE